MNKQEAMDVIESISYYEKVNGNPLEDLVNKIYDVLKPVVPEFVGEWIGYKKAEGYTLYGTLMEAEANPIIKKWLSPSRQEVLAIAWIFGYDIEKKRWSDV